MSCRARHFVNDIELDFKYLNKYFEVNDLDEILKYHRNEFQTRTEYLQKRRERLHEKEIMFKERILSQEMYIKELAMKRDRSLRRIVDEKNLLKIKQIDIDILRKDIEQIQEEKMELQKMLVQYQPHLNLLTQIVDQSDRFHSIDEMIEKFDILHASFQDILLTIQNSNEELNNLQRQLLITNEKKTNHISLMNNRIHELEQNRLDIQQRIEKNQIEIRNYQQISTEHLTEIGAMNLAIESMFDLVRKYSYRNRKKEFNLNNQNLLEKLNQIDTFLSDLIYYVNYGNNKQKKILSNKQSIQSNHGHISMDVNNRWRDSCQIDQREMLVKDTGQPYVSYKIRGEDNKFYTIQMINIDQSKTRQSLAPNRSSISQNKEKKNSSFIISPSTLQRSINTQPRLSTIESLQTTFKLSNDQFNY